MKERKIEGWKNRRGMIWKIWKMKERVEDRKIKE